MIAWLQSKDVVQPDGGVLSWHNPDHPGYPYPEISGLLLSLLARCPAADHEVRQRIADHLGRDLTGRGVVSRWGADYVFDTAMVFGGLRAHREAGGSIGDAQLLARLGRSISTMLRRRKTAEGFTASDAGRWSTSYGCHLLKSALAITAFEDSDAMTASAAQQLIDQLLADLLPLQTEGRFRIHAESNASYLHAHCYATEGLLCLERRGLTGHSAAILASAQWLGEIQQPSGGINAWHDGEVPSGDEHTDATAQAVRIWSLVDRERFAAEIGGGLRFLASVSTECGGLRYSPVSEDINTWATIFACQAVQWSSAPGDPLWLA